MRRSPSRCAWCGGRANGSRAERSRLEAHAARLPRARRTSSPTPSATLGLRVAVNTGEVVVSDDHADVVGDPVNVAARLQQEAHDGDVVIGESTQRLVGELVTLAPLRRPHPEGARPRRWRRTAWCRSSGRPARRRPRSSGATTSCGASRRSTTRPSRRPPRAPGRDPRIAGPRQVAPARRVRAPARGRGDGADRALRRGRRRHLRAARRGAARAPAHRRRRQRRRAARGDRRRGCRGDDCRARPDRRRDRARCSPARRRRRRRPSSSSGACSPRSPRRSRWCSRSTTCSGRSRCCSTSTEHLVQWSTGVPLLVLVAARPELRDARSSLAAPGGLVADVVTLAGLDAGAATRLAANVIGADELPAAVAGRVLATSEGNPLFVGELVRMLVQRRRAQAGGRPLDRRRRARRPRDAADHPRAARRAHRAAACRRSAPCSSAPRSSGGTSRAPPSPTCCRARCSRPRRAARSRCGAAS